MKIICAKYLGISLAFVAALLLIGCKVRIIVPEGGNVVSSSGAYDCYEEQKCTIPIYDLFFYDIFTAQPESHYRFIKWRKRDKSLCAKKPKPCTIDSSLADRHPSFLEILESDMVFYLEPVFGLASEGPLAGQTIAYNPNSTGGVDPPYEAVVGPNSEFEGSFTYLDYDFDEYGLLTIRPPSPSTTIYPGDDNWVEFYDLNGMRSQPVDATHWLNRSAGVS